MTKSEEALLRRDSVSPAIYTPATVARGGSASVESAREPDCMKRLVGQSERLREAIERGEARMPRLRGKKQ